MKQLFLIILISLSAFSEQITGFWKSYNEKTKQPEIMVAIYLYKDKYYGRIVAIYDKSGKIRETIYKPVDRTEGIIGHPYYCGLELIYDLKNKGNVYKGKILDPEKGNLYNAEVWRKEENLIVRGKLLFFGRNLTWRPVKEEEFSFMFPKPDVTQFVPVIPKTL
ncbi:MAG: DUF2147 domain-containing protein [Chlamydiae bacterium]|nr:DUF2147 domain-containing protein [Chlamydiota bacterium]